MSTVRRRDFLALAGVGLALGACGGAGPAPQDSFYRLTIDDPGRRFGRPLLDGTVEVARFSADGLASERAIVHAPSGPALRRYNYHYWVDSPTRLVQEAVMQALRVSDAAPRVVGTDTRVPSDYRVTGKLGRLQHETGQSGGEVVVDLEINVIDTSRSALVMVGDYSVRRRVESDGVPAAVIAFRQALTEIVGRFLDELAAANGQSASG